MSSNGRGEKNGEKRKRDCEKEERHAARGCPSVWVPLTPKERTKFLADINGWVIGWGESEHDWYWLESLLDKAHWTDEDRREMQQKANRGMGFAMDQLTGASSGTTDERRCQWTQMRNQCHNAAPVMHFDAVEKTILKTSIADLTAQMERIRSGEWMHDENLHREAAMLFEAGRRDMLDEIALEREREQQKTTKK